MNLTRVVIRTARSGAGRHALRRNALPTVQQGRAWKSDSAVREQVRKPHIEMGSICFLSTAARSSRHRQFASYNLEVRVLRVLRVADLCQRL